MINNYSDVRTPVGFAKIQLYFDILNKIFQSFPPRVAPLAQSTHYHPPHPPHNPPRHNRGDAPPPAASTPAPPLRAAKIQTKLRPITDSYRFVRIPTSFYRFLPIARHIKAPEPTNDPLRIRKKPEVTGSHPNPSATHPRASDTALCSKQSDLKPKSPFLQFARYYQRLTLINFFKFIIRPHPRKGVT